MTTRTIIIYTIFAVIAISFGYLVWYVVRNDRK